MNGTPMVELKNGKRVPAPVGVATARAHPFAVFADAIDTHLWRKAALDMFESHMFTGKPGEARWCCRCTLQLAPDWKVPGKALAPKCGDPRILPVPAVYEYVEGNPVNGVRLADPNYAGAKLAEDKEPDACT
jgi:hypothetical protein